MLYNSSKFTKFWLLPCSQNSYKLTGVNCKSYKTGFIITGHIYMTVLLCIIHHLCLIGDYILNRVHHTQDVAIMKNL